MENGVNGGSTFHSQSDVMSNGMTDSEHRSKEHKSSSHKKHKHKDKDRERRDHKSHKSKRKDHDKDRHHGSSKSHSSSKSDKSSSHGSKDHRSSSGKPSADNRSLSSSKSSSGSSKERDHQKHKERSSQSPRKEFSESAPHQYNGREDSRRDSDDFRVISPKHIKREHSAEENGGGRSAAGGDVSDEDCSRLVIEDDSAAASDNSSPPAQDDNESEEDIPLSARKKPKIKKERLSDSFKQEADDSEEDMPLSARRKSSSKSSSKIKRRADSDDDDEYQKPAKVSKVKKESVGAKRKSAGDGISSPTKKIKKEEEEREVWKWWEEEKSDPSVKWNSLEHKGPLLAPEYEPLPSSVKFYYDGKEMKLSAPTEEVATFYAKMLDHDYTTKEVFNKNFWHDWRKFMTEKERERITSLKKCDFRRMAEYFKIKSEEKKAMSKEEKKAIKQKNEDIVKEYGFCILDGHKEKIGNFRVEPPGLFRGRGEHPKQGLVKRRVEAKDIIINCGRNSKVPEPPPGQRWKKVQHDNTVTWLACWKENIQGMIKYVMLNAASRLKGEKDWSKYETARRLHKCVDTIRESYRSDFKSKEMRIRQRAVAMYFIDKLALRAGNEKDEDQADTVGCCSLRVEHIKLHEQLNGKEYVVVFDFLGKDSIRYYNEVSVEKRVFKNLTLFVDNKEPGDDLFDRLNTTILNKYLTEQMDCLTAKVFRTYNASHTLQEQLDLLTEESMTVNEKILAYNRANRAVAILCNHQRAVPKTFEKSMENLMAKIADKKEQVAEAEKQYKSAKKAAKNSSKESIEADKKKKTLQRLSEQLSKLELSATDKEENKEIALGTSKLNYLDPRISVAWCKKWNVPVEKVYNKTQREKFRWAIDMAGPDFEF